MIPLWFLDFYRVSGYLPSAEDPNQFVDVCFSHSMYDNVRSLGLPFLAFLSIGLLAASAIVTLISIRNPDRPRIKHASNELFWIAVPLFLALLLMEFFMGYGI